MWRSALNFSSQLGGKVVRRVNLHQPPDQIRLAPADGNATIATPPGFLLPAPRTAPPLRPHIQSRSAHNGRRDQSWERSPIGIRAARIGLFFSSPISDQGFPCSFRLRAGCPLLAAWNRELAAAFSIALKAFSISRTNSTNSAARTDFFAWITTSTGTVSPCRFERTAARNRRRMRFRTTAPPSADATASPILGPE